MKEKGALVRGRLMGDPSYEYEHTDVRRVRDGDEYTEEEVTVRSLWMHFTLVVIILSYAVKHLMFGVQLNFDCLMQIHTNLYFMQYTRLSSIP